MALNLYTSNRMELLVEYLSMVLDQEKLPPLESEIIIVQSQGMARFLAMELAQRKGVWAGGEFPFPNAFLQGVFGRILGGDVSQEPWQRGTLTWRIFNLLPSLLGEPGFEVVESYCQSPEKIFQLSQQLSDLFDQYVLYRPEMIQGWSQGKDRAWQAVLWQHLVQDIEQPHRAEQFAKVLKELFGDFTGDLPKRISLFGISSMAPLMTDVFGALGSHIQVNVFFLNPCQVEWSQIMTSGSITKLELATGLTKEAQFLENGNELLASMGHLGRDFFDLFLAHNPNLVPMSVPATEPTLLGFIQNDILDLQTPEGNRRLDDSLHLVSCHNGMREVEVLLDHLLHLFNQNDDLQPRDVLVMAPDIGVYAPLIDAVFRTGGKNALPFSIADESMQDQECFAGFLELLKVAKGRWRVTDIMSLMEIPALCRKFGFSEDDLALIKEWLGEVHIHWGRDARHRSSLGLPPSSEHSFRAGINRLLLGFAMDGDELFKGTLPFQGRELNVDVAGKFLSFYEQLLALASFLPGAKGVQEWSRGLLSVVDDFFEPGSEQEWQIGQLRTILATLARDVELSGFGQQISPEIIDIWLEKALNLDLSPYGFLSGGITFCSLLPMRAIPFQLVCLLGMNDGDFPRTQIRPGFDLTAHDFRPGDRNRRNDDRYLFLEALLSARRQLYISFVGRSIIDNREILPSVLVSELLDYMQGSLGEDVNELVVQHPIQPFNSDYFNGTLPMSFSRENYQGCQVFMGRLSAEGQPLSQGFLDGLDVPGHPLGEVIAFADVLRFWKNPAAFFCGKTLGLQWDERESPLTDDEPFTLAGLQQYHVAVQCVESWLDHGQPTLAKIRGTGFLPQGLVGEFDFDRVSARAEQLVTRLQPKMKIPCDDVQTTLVCGDYSLDLTLSHLYKSGQVIMDVTRKIDGRHVVRAWLLHLALQLVDTGCEKTTFLITADEMIEFQPMENGKEVLSLLLHHYHQGLCSPLPFFAKSSWEYARVTAEKGAFTALGKAKQIFNPEYKQFSAEGDEAAIVRCFGDYVLGEPFTALARQLFDPVLEVAILK